MVQLMNVASPAGKAVVERLAAAIYKQGELAAEQGDSAGAINQFLRIGKDVPSSKIKSTAHYDAATLLLENQSWQKAINS